MVKSKKTTRGKSPARSHASRRRESHSIHYLHMSMLRALGQIIIAVTLVFIVVVSTQSTLATDGTTWPEAKNIKLSGGQFIDYRRLSETGDAVYYRVDIAVPSIVRFDVSISRSASTKFVPQVVVYEPSDQTIGPLLPLDQPPETIARVYPITQTRTVFNAFTQTQTDVRLEAQPEFTVPGTYIFAVYNAGTVGGQYRLMLDRGASIAQWQDAWQMPKRWWQDQAFAGFSWLTLITPALITLVVWLVYLRLDHHQLHVHKAYPQPVNKKSKP